ncbi:MAG TPA: hypothetical protein VHD31_00495 [Candidatus Paceibacterota bacterium]|nr:hypothetical protein [Candidatus Paceibacterota bacterium]
MSKGVLFILLGLLIDGFQAFMSVALFAVGALPGPIGGCFVGTQIAGDIGCKVLGAIGGLPFVNGILAVATLPISMGMGIALGFCISATLGVFLIALMGFNGILYPKYLIWGGGELIPGLNIIPFWTTLTILCVLKKNAEEGTGVLSIAGNLTTSATSPGATVATIAGGVNRGPSQDQSQQISQQEQEGPVRVETPERTPALQLGRGVDSDIKPPKQPTVANDNLKIPRAANDTLKDIEGGRGRTAYAA